MARFLIETRHTSEHDGCVRALDAITRFGSHFATHAEFGCEVGEHAGWLIVDVDDLETASQMVPPQYREGAKVIRLSRWTREQIEEMLKRLES